MRENGFGNPLKAMHLLVISPAPSAPPNQGNRQRIHGVCKAFKERGAIIHFGYLPREWGGNYDAEDQAKMSDQWDFCDTIIPTGKLRYRAKGPHHEIDEWWDEAVDRYVRYKCTGVAFDACLVNYAFLSKAFEALPPNVVRILDTHDRLSGRKEMLEQHGVEPEFFYTTEAEEQIALNRADLILAITPEEASVFRTMTTKPVMTLGHLPERPNSTRVEPSTARTVRMGFIGSANSVNSTNLSSFFTVLAATAPDGIEGVEFHIYGKCCSHVHVPPECKPYVHLHGRVDDLAAAYRAIDCVFVPFMFGTGQKIKLIEALSFAKPLIATASASEGSGSSSPHHQLKSHAAVVAAIQKFAGDLGFRETLLEASRQTFAAYEAGIDRAIAVLFTAATSRMLQVSISQPEVAAALKGRSRSEIVDEVCRIGAMMDALETIGKFTNRDAARRALFRGAEDALAGRSGEEVDAPDLGDALAENCTTVAFAGLLGSAASATRTEILINLPISEKLKTTTRADDFEIYVECQPALDPTRAHDLQTKTMRMPTPERRYRTFKGFDQILVLSTDIRSELVITHIRSFANELSLRVKTPVLITSVDADGRRAKWTGDTLSQIRPSESLEQAIRRARELPQKLPSIALALGFSQTSASAFHRLVLAECGPIISLAGGRVHAIDGEVIARTTREAALWSSRFLIAPRWATTFAVRTRASVSAVEGMETQSAIIRLAHHERLEKKMKLLFSDLQSREITQPA